MGDAAAAAGSTLPYLTRRCGAAPAKAVAGSTVPICVMLRQQQAAHCRTSRDVAVLRPLFTASSCCLADRVTGGRLLPAPGPSPREQGALPSPVVRPVVTLPPATVRGDTPAAAAAAAALLERWEERAEVGPPPPRAASLMQDTADLLVSTVTGSTSSPRHLQECDEGLVGPSPRHLHECDE